MRSGIWRRKLARPGFHVRITHMCMLSALLRGRIARTHRDRSYAYTYNISILKTGRVGRIDDIGPKGEAKREDAPTRSKRTKATAIDEK